jgi:hypothetical protein
LGRYAERAAVLDRLAALLQAGPVADAPPDRDWRCELWAERSIDAGRERRQRLLADAERIAAATDWWPTHIGRSFLLDAAELLDRVGRAEAARDRWQQARDTARPDDEEVMQTTAVLCARSGDPHLALELLQQLARGDWLEKRTIWRHTGGSRAHRARLSEAA